MPPIWTLEQKNTRLKDSIVPPVTTIIDQKSPPDCSTAYLNPKLMALLDTAYDHMIIEGGTAGCALALERKASRVVLVI